MIHVTPNGHSIMMKAIQSTANSAHLMTEDGELTGYGYRPMKIDPDQWVNGEYPKMVWEFSNGDPINVIGYYVVDENDSILWSEQFTDGPQEIKNTGDRIGVTIRLSLLAGA